MTTQEDGTITVEGMFPGTYTVTEAGYDRYEPQRVKRLPLSEEDDDGNVRQ